MVNVNYFFLLLFLLIYTSSMAQKGRLTGSVSADGNGIEYATVVLEETNQGTVTSATGSFEILDIPFGSYTMTTSYIGYKPVTERIVIDESHMQVVQNVILSEPIIDLDYIVVTGTKTFKRKTNTPVIVNVIDSKKLDDIQACNLSESLKFQPGLRVETDCQTCNYTQLRMNGLGGGYSQILVNGRPIFSPLTGLYGLEQLPVNMIDRIEVVRGAGSSLYGSSAIGGTVNVLTKLPSSNSYELNYNYHNINGETHDNQLLGNVTVVSENENSGISFFINKRQRGLYDHNGDNYSELPALENTSIGSNLILKSNDHHKLELSLSNLNEYRYGGEMIETAPHLAQQSEERIHNVWMANADYQINFNGDNSSMISYVAWQNTDRKHYTGILPEEGIALQSHLEAPPYGTSDVSTINAGVQFNHRLSQFLSGANVLTLGAEYIYDDVFDEISSYNYLIDQATKNVGLFAQSDWQISPRLTLLTGARFDHHNLIDNPIITPRLSLLYKFLDGYQFRINYGQGFRAPQAFDTDLHIAFASGGISRVILSPDLRPEKSKSINASINYDKPTEKYIVGYTIEGFYTTLQDAFFLEPVGEDDFGFLFEKLNKQTATVKGLSIELRANYNRQVQLESGMTFQSSKFADEVKYIDELDGIREFVRTPNAYGFSTLSYMPNDKISINLNYVYTGSMKVPHFAGAPNQLLDEIIDTPTFHDLSTKVSYVISLDTYKSEIEIYTGIKNLFNSYQEVFDIGKNRDSNFVYGSAQPRTYFVGVKYRSQ